MSHRKGTDNVGHEPNVLLHGNVAVVHCCCVLNPQTFKARFGRTKLSYEQLNEALWAVTHDWDVPIPDLQKAMGGVAYVTAEIARDKIRAILLRTHSGE